MSMLSNISVHKKYPKEGRQLSLVMRMSPEICKSKESLCGRIM